MEVIDLIGHLVSPRESAGMCAQPPYLHVHSRSAGMDIIFIYLHKGRLSSLASASDRNRAAGLYFIHPLLNSGSISRKCLYHGHPVLVLSLLCLFWLGSGFPSSLVFPSLQLLYVVGIPISLCSARPPPFPSPPTSRAPPSSFPTGFLPALLSKTTRSSRFSLNLYYDTFAFSRLDNRSQPSSNTCRLSRATPCTLNCFCMRESFVPNRQRADFEAIVYIWEQHTYIRFQKYDLFMLREKQVQKSD